MANDDYLVFTACISSMQVMQLVTCSLQIGGDAESGGKCKLRYAITVTISYRVRTYQSEYDVKRMVETGELVRSRTAS